MCETALRRHFVNTNSTIRPRTTVYVVQQQSYVIVPRGSSRGRSLRAGHRRSRRRLFFFYTDSGV